MFTKITTGVIAGAALVAVATPAQAQHRYGGYHNRGNRTALALGAGALGLAVGAAISNNNRGYYGRGDGYYGRGGYYGDRYYDGGYYAGGYGYGGGHYGGGGGYYGRPYAYGYGNGYGRRCWTDRQWDDWRGRWRRVRVCN